MVTQGYLKQRHTLALTTNILNDDKEVMDEPITDVKLITPKRKLLTSTSIMNLTSSTILSMPSTPIISSRMISSYSTPTPKQISRLDNRCSSVATLAKMHMHEAS
jgi:hypothetical protein